MILNAGFVINIIQRITIIGMSNPFKKQNNQKPQEMLLDRIIKQNAQNPGLQLNSILPTTSNNGNNGQRVNNGTNQIIQANRARTQQRSENVNIQQVGTLIKPSPEENKKQSTNLHANHFNPFATQRPYVTHQNRILAPSPPEASLLIKIVGKDGVALGSFRLDRSEVLQKKDVTIKEIKIEEAYKKQLTEMWNLIKQGKKALDVFILMTNLGILTSSQKNPHNPMPDNLIRRLKQGMQFYDFQPERESTMAKLLQQNIECNSNVALCQQIQKVRNMCKTDKFIGLYCILQNPTYLETKVDLPSFLMQDKIYLIRLYQYLSKSSRLSSRKLISLDEQLYILRQIVKYLIPLFPNEKSPPIDAHIELGRQVIRLLQIIFVDNSSEVTAQQVRNSFIPMLYDLKSIGIKNSTIKSFLNNFEFGLLLQWGNELEHMQLGCIQTFVQYYRSQKEMEGKMLTLTMMKLSQIAVYDEKMCEMVDRKQRKFVQTNKSVLQKRTNKSRMINIGIQCILLIKQSNKTNFKLYESQLIKLLYHVCPVSIMGFHSNSYTNLELVLPFISRYFKKSVNTQSQYVTIAQINQFLPQFYKFQSCSDNFTIAKYIMSLIKYLQANQFNTMIDPKCKLSEVEQVLKRLNISTLLSNTEISPLQLVRLLSKYIANYTQEYHYRGDSVRKSQKKQSKNKRKEQIGKLLNMLYQTMNNIIQYSVKQHEQNKNNSKQICLIGYGKILVNITLVANLIGCSGLLPNNQKNVIVQTSSNAVVGVHEADIPKHYHKIMQTLYKSYTTQQSSSKHRQIIQEHIRSGIKICREWQQNIKYKQKINNYLVYLLTAQYMYKISKETQLQPNLMFMNKYITYLNILQYVIQISNSCASFTPNYWYFVSTTLLLLPKMFSTHLYNHTAFDPSLAQLLLNNRQIIIALCLNRICAKQYAQANELYETISYLQLIRQLLCISQEQAELSNSRQSIMESRNKQDRVILDTIPNKMRKEIIEKGKILKRQNNQTILMSKILVVIAQIEIIYEGKIQELIQHQDYIDEVVSSILSLLVYYLNKVPSKNRHYLYDNESQQDICMWNIRCMNLFENIFHSPAGITIKIDKAHTLAQTCLKIIKSKAVKIRANGSEIISWIQILLPMIHKNIKSVKIYEVLLEQSILFLCQQKDQQQHRNYKMKQKRQHIKLVELIMVYLSNEHRISELFEEKCLLEKVLRSLMVILDNVFTLFMTQSSTYFKLSQLQTWYRTAVVSLVKISQFINIYYLMLTQKNERISDSLLAACTKTKLVLEQSSKNYPLLAMSAQKQQNIKQMILCCVSILSLGSENTNQYQRKIYFNQALINVSMGNKQSFKAFFLHLANQAIDNRTIYRQKHEQKSRVNKNYEQEVDANKYRSYYLLYYFINKILTSNDSHSRVYFMYQTQTNKIDNKLNQIMRDLLDHLIQPILIQDLNQNLWFLVLVHRMVKLDLGILQKGVCCQRILQFCCRTIDRLSLIKQSKANKRKSTRNYERFSLLKQNEEILYFEDWLVFVQVLGITCLVFRTSAHSSLPSNGNSLSFIRSFVFNKIKSFLMTWGNFELDVKKKLMLFPFSSFLNTNPSKQLVVKYLSQGLLEVQKQKKSDSKQLMGEQKEVTVQNYIKTTMMLSSIALILNLIKHDLLFLSGSQQGVKSKFMEFVQQVLASFGYFYDIYFQNASISLKNHQIISQNIDLHIKDPISTKNNCYLNKILREYWLIPAQGAGSQKLLRKQISRILDQKKQELSAILWYNNIDEALVSLGYKPSHKFITKSGINNGSMMLKSRMGNSLRFV